MNRHRDRNQSVDSNEDLSGDEALSPNKRAKVREPWTHSSFSSSSSSSSMGAPSRQIEYGEHGSGASVSQGGGPPVRNGPIAKGEEIAATLMQVAEKPDRCWNFDLQHWLTLYRTVRFRDVNFPEAAMLISCSAQIYGRKVDYLSDIIMHMNDDQKAREKKTREEEKGKSGQEGGGEQEVEETAAANKSTGRKRAGRFNPQSLSDCFGDLEFTCNDRKLAKLESLVQPVPIVDVDRRTKVQQMQDLCTELRTNPSRQRRQEILNRLRDDACIAPIMSSNGAARKNQILDLESGETIGTRYDYQIHLNYIDGRTGSLIAEHDLKRFFQRCDVMDFLSEQHETERARCTRLGMPTPADRQWQGERELKLFMPPEYLNNRYRIKLNDTTDFDNALIQARVTSFSSDPILSLMDHALRAQNIAAQQLPAEWNDPTISTTTMQSKASEILNDSGFDSKSTSIIQADDSDPSFSGALSSSRTDDSTIEKLEDSGVNASDESEQDTSHERSIDAALESQDKCTDSSLTDASEKSASAASRLSVDEGIGVDRESPPRAAETTVPVGGADSSTKSGSVLFTGGTVFPRSSPVLRPVKLVQNILGIPEDLARKHIQFALPNEYRKMKSELVKQREAEANELKSFQLHRLKPTAKSMLRPSTPEPEDFLGFEDELQTPTKTSPRKMKYTSSASNESSPVKQRRPSTPELSFEGFDEQDIIAARKRVEALRRCPEKPKPPVSPKRGNGSLPATPTRTLSCDSGISDTVDRSGKEPVNATLLDAIADDTDHTECDLPTLEDDDGGGEDGTEGQSKPVTHQPRQEHTDASNARIQASMNEAKERFDKVSQWHRKLKPILIESEKRNHFDIHAYGTEIIETFDPTVPLGAESITLETVLQNKPPHSTARFFLSVLMLANTNNVHITNRNPDSLRLSSTAEIELRLLSRKRHHKELEALGELLPPPASTDGSPEPERNRQKRQNRKRKHAVQQQPVEAAHGAQEAATREDPSSRVGGGLNVEAGDDDASFFDNVQQMYEDLNSEVSHRRRLAFRRGMRNCAYGLGDAMSSTLKEGETQPEKSSSGSQPVRGKPPPPNAIPQQRNLTVCPTRVTMHPEEDVLSVDLLTNSATLVPVRDTDTMCAKSVYSMAESGYESMFSGGDDV
uniref:Condensin-2 complex subunit H2 C-terminal domain-containing protein n=1 Tax=Anopheles stephensi TaxID=30069 RepID=A0A182Y454_ANOST